MKNCIVCKKEYEQKTKKGLEQKYCSHSCRMKAYQKRKKNNNSDINFSTGLTECKNIIKIKIDELVRLTTITENLLEEIKFYKKIENLLNNNNN